MNPYFMSGAGPAGQNDMDELETSPYRSKFTVLRLT